MKFRSLFSISNFYIALFCIYSLQGTFYPFGSMPAKIVLFIGLAFSLYYWIYANVKYNLPPVLKALNLILVMFTVYGVFYYIRGDLAVKEHTGAVLTATEFLKNIYKSLLPLYAFYVFFKEGKLSENTVRLWLPIFLVVCAGKFMVYEQQRFLNSSYDTDGLTNNVAYDFLSLFPLLYFVKEKKLWQYGMLAVMMIFILYGMKRGAILISMILLVWFMINSLKDSSTNSKLVVIAISALLVVLLYRYVAQLANSSMYFQYRLEKTIEGDSSGRDEYYTFFLHYFGNLTKPLKILLGGGAYETVRINGNMAHNDWLELLINNGILGIILYIIYMKRLYYCFKSYRKTIFQYLILSVFTIVLLKSLFSMSYTGYTIYLSIALSYFLVNTEYNGERVI